MDDLIAFVRARLDGTRAALIRYRDGHEGPHINYAGQDPDYYDEYDSCHRCIEVARLTPYRDVEFGLVDVETKRRVVERAEFVVSNGPARDSTRVLDMTIGAEHALRDVLRDLASAWSDHPQYDAERWAP